MLELGESVEAGRGTVPYIYDAVCLCVSVFTCALARQIPISNSASHQFFFYKRRDLSSSYSLTWRQELHYMHACTLYILDR